MLLSFLGGKKLSYYHFSAIAAKFHTYKVGFPAVTRLSPKVDTSGLEFSR